MKAPGFAGGWLLAKVRIERWRSAQRHHRLFVDEPAEELEVPDPSSLPEDCLQAELRFERICRRLSELGKRTRDVLLLHRLHGLTCPQIAAELGVSVSAIEKHIARAICGLTEERKTE